MSRKRYNNTMKSSIMPTYEQLAVRWAKAEQDKAKMAKTIERLKKRPARTITKVVRDDTGWYALAIIFTIFIVAVGMFIINEKYQVL